MPEHEAVLVMGSIHRVLKAEKALRSGGLPVETRITPREVSADCGMVVALAGADLQRALEMLASAGVSPMEVWKFESGAFRLAEGAAAGWPPD